MRLDKFLKVSRLIKRRTVAKEACEAGRLKVNERQAKAGTTITPGDTLELEFGRKILIVEVVETPNAVKANEASNLYKVIAEREKSE
ncbi:ribosomal 50S subunit-recycling heat shock protein [Desulfitispora alkaliphila]|uniref:RNA-binding S4 domain-containing protein n=1 Tax=Desulfitispora alkaliphila TaxID=622674 RepID=UPI003D1AE8DD